jgi:NADPH:quinone reductase-like Zn-dependent oxidoreductase
MACYLQRKSDFTSPETAMETVLTELAAFPQTAASARPMRAVVHRRYGEPEVLAMEELGRPAPRAGEVLVRVHAAGATVGDHHVVTGKPYLFRLSPFGGFPRPRHLVPGGTFSGRVEALGPGVSGFSPGDEVMGQVSHGAWAEYVAAPATQLALKPANLALDEAAVVPWGTVALQALRDAGSLRAGQKVLINGASGGVGTWAVQLARAMGAEVTGVCSTRNVELVRGLGAHHVIDYTREDFAAGGARFDLLVDLVGNRPLGDCLRALSPRGTYVACSGGGGDWVGPLFRLGVMLVRSIFSRRKLKTFIQAVGSEDLITLRERIESGEAKPVIERRFPLSETAAALRHVGEGHSRGQTVIRVEG